MTTSQRRLLHYVLKIGQRPASMRFFCDVLGMHVLRHEEFAAGCEATCNGPYQGRWSKTMIGYGDESRLFVLELTYNYGVGSYRLGNDLRGVSVVAPGVVARTRQLDYPSEQQSDGSLLLLSPDGYRFYVTEGSVARVSRCSLACSQLDRSRQFWTEVLGLRVVDREEENGSACIKLRYDGIDSTMIELVGCGDGGAVERGSAFGRTAIACPTAELEAAQTSVTTSGCGCRVQTPLVRLETPGKADVHVVIAADPDGHEVCLVGTEGFAELSQVDPKADSLLAEAMAADKSDEWFARKGGKLSE